MRVPWDFWQVSHGGNCFLVVFSVFYWWQEKKEVARKRIDISKTDSPRIDAKKTFISKTCWFQTYPNISIWKYVFPIFFVHNFRAKVQSLWRMTLPSRQALDSRDFSLQGGAYHIIHINMHHSGHIGCPSIVSRYRFWACLNFWMALIGLVFCVLLSSLKNIYNKLL